MHNNSVLCFSHNPNAKKLYSTSARSIPAVPSAYLAELHYFWCTTTVVRIRRVRRLYYYIYCNTLLSRRSTRSSEIRGRQTMAKGHGYRIFRTFRHHTSDLSYFSFFFFRDLPIRSTITNVVAPTGVLQSRTKTTTICRIVKDCSIKISVCVL